MIAVKVAQYHHGKVTIRETFAPQRRVAAGAGVEEDAPGCPPGPEKDGRLPLAARAEGVTCAEENNLDAIGSDRGRGRREGGHGALLAAAADERPPAFLFLFGIPDPVAPPAGGQLRPGEGLPSLFQEPRGETEDCPTVSGRKPPGVFERILVRASPGSQPDLDGASLAVVVSVGKNPKIEGHSGSCQRRGTRSRGPGSHTRSRAASNGRDKPAGP